MKENNAVSANCLKHSILLRLLSRLGIRDETKIEERIFVTLDNLSLRMRRPHYR